MLIPEAISESAAASATYTVSNRTLIGFGTEYIRSDSPQFKVSGNSGSASLTRIQRRWFYSVSAGFAENRSGNERHQTITFGSGIGIKTRSHVVVGTYDRGIGDRYIGALGTPWFVDTINAAWHWRPFRANWWVDSVFVDRRAITTGLATTNTWEQRETLTRSIGRHFMIAGDWTVGRVGARRYVQAGRRYQLAQNAYRVSLTWLPQVPRVNRGRP